MILSDGEIERSINKKYDIKSKVTYNPGSNTGNMGSYTVHMESFDGIEFEVYLSDFFSPRVVGDNYLARVKVGDFDLEKALVSIQDEIGSEYIFDDGYSYGLEYGYAGSNFDSDDDSDYNSYSDVRIHLKLIGFVPIDLEFSEKFYKVIAVLNSYDFNDIPVKVTYDYHDSDFVKTRGGLTDNGLDIFQRLEFSNISSIKSVADLELSVASKFYPYSDGKDVSIYSVNVLSGLTKLKHDNTSSLDYRYRIVCVSPKIVDGLRDLNNCDSHILVLESSSELSSPLFNKDKLVSNFMYFIESNNLMNNELVDEIHLFIDGSSNDGLPLKIVNQFKSSDDLKSHLDVLVSDLLLNNKSN